jgi:hypothetical protein
LLHVRFAPESGHAAVVFQCPLVPEADIERYSITSSARARKFSGILRPKGLCGL